MQKIILIILLLCTLLFAGFKPEFFGYKPYDKKATVFEEIGKGEAEYYFLLTRAEISDFVSKTSKIYGSPDSTFNAANLRAWFWNYKKEHAAIFIRFYDSGERKALNKTIYEIVVK